MLVRFTSPYTVIAHFEDKTTIRSSGLFYEEEEMITTSIMSITHPKTGQYCNILEICSETQIQPSKHLFLNVANRESLPKIQKLKMQVPFFIITNRINKMERECQLVIHNIDLKMTQKVQIQEEPLHTIKYQPKQPQKQTSPIVLQIPQIPQIQKMVPFFDTFSWDLTTPFANYFIVKDKIVTRTKDDGKQVQITSQQSIPKGQITSLTFKITSYGFEKYSMSFGIITQSRKNEQLSYGGNKEAVGYMTSPTLNRKIGSIYCDGNEVKDATADLFVSAGGEVSMKVDTQKYEISFINRSKPQKEYKCQLDQPHWRQKNIYLYVSMNEPVQSLYIAR